MRRGWASLAMGLLWSALLWSAPGCGMTLLDRDDDQGPRPAFAAVVDDPSAAMSAEVVTPTVSIDGIEYRSLVAAVIAAQDGDVLQLQPGLHGGPVEIRASITLEPSASLGAVTVQSRSATCMSIRGDVKVIVRGLTLRADGRHGDSREAAVTVDGGELSLEYCHIGARANCAVQVLDGALTMEQCSVLVEQWQTAVTIGAGSESWISDCRIENREQPGTAVEAWGASCQISGGRLAATAAAVVAGDDSTVTAEKVHLIDGGVVAREHGRLTLKDCDLVGSVKAAVRCFGVAMVEGCRMQQHALGLLLSGPDARLTVIDPQWTSVAELIAYEDRATEAQLFMEGSSLSTDPSPSGGR